MKVLIAVDDKDTASEIVDFVRTEICDKDTEFNLVHVIAPLMLDHPMASYPLFLESIAIEIETDAKRLLTEATEKLKSLGLRAQFNLLSGSPVYVILEAAKDWHADLIVVGTHARRGFDKFVYGSVASDIAGAATCSVFVLRLKCAKVEEVPSEPALHKNVPFSKVVL